MLLPSESRLNGPTPVALGTYPGVRLFLYGSHVMHTKKYDSYHDGIYPMILLKPDYFQM